MYRMPQARETKAIAKRAPITYGIVVSFLLREEKLSLAQNRES
jgi:hypothetical protein